MFILKGLLVIIIFIFLLGLIGAIWLKYTFRRIRKKMEKNANQNSGGTTNSYQKKQTGSKFPHSSGDYVDFEEIETKKK